MSNSFLFINVTNIYIYIYIYIYVYQFKGKNSETKKSHLLCLENISEDFSANNTKNRI